MAGGRSCAIPAAVLGSVATGPAIVLAFCWSASAIATGGSESGKLLGEGVDLRESGDEFFAALGECFGEGGIGVGEIGDSRTISSSGGGQVGNGVDGVVLVLVSKVCRMKTCSSWGDVECFIILFVCNVEIKFELGPSFVGLRVSFPKFAIISKNAGAEDALIRNTEDLGGRVRGLSGGGKFHGVFNLFVKNFNGLVDVARLLHGQTILLEVGRVDVGIVGVQMSKKLKRCTSAETDIG